MHRINVSIAYAAATEQWQESFTVMRGTSAQELLELSGFMTKIDKLKGVTADQLKLGVFAQAVEPDHLLQEGDRLEIYRPLRADPKEVRRQLALLGKTMGKSS